MTESSSDDSGVSEAAPEAPEPVLLESGTPDRHQPTQLGESPARPGSTPERFRDFRYQPGDRVLEGYTIQAPLGHGGFGEVYHARSDAGKDVALKLVQRYLEVELRGVRHCLNLKHTNLVTIFDMRPDSADQQWIVMEYVPGENLAQAIERHPQGMPVEEALHWLEGIAAAVEHLHQAGIVHRDLKPSNVISDQGEVKVGDYGLSKFIKASRRSGQTQSVGTVHYMAPEIGGGRYGREVDVYAIGVVLFEMLTGDVPFDGETPAEILMKHLTATPDIARLPAPFRGVVARMLAKHPDERYGSLAAVMADLRARLQDAALHPVTEGEPAPPPLPYSAGVSTWLEDRLGSLLHPQPKPTTPPVAASDWIAPDSPSPPTLRSPLGPVLVSFGLLLVGWLVASGSQDAGITVALVIAGVVTFLVLSRRRHPARPRHRSVSWGKIALASAAVAGAIAVLLTFTWSIRSQEDVRRAEAVKQINEMRQLDAEMRARARQNQQDIWTETEVPAGNAVPYDQQSLVVEADSRNAMSMDAEASSSGSQTAVPAGGEPESVTSYPMQPSFRQPMSTPVARMPVATSSTPATWVVTVLIILTVLLVGNLLGFRRPQPAPAAAGATAFPATVPPARVERARPSSAAGVSRSTSKRQFGWFGSMILSLLMGIGTGLVMGGVTHAIFGPREEEMAVAIGLGLGVIAAGTVLVNTAPLALRRLWWRLGVALILGGISGLMTFLLGGLVDFDLEVAAVMGFCIGLAMAFLGACWQFIDQARVITWQRIVLLTPAIGLTLLASGLLMAIDIDEDSVLGVTCGVIILIFASTFVRIASSSSGVWPLRAFSCLVGGIGGGLLIGCTLSIFSSEESAVLAGIGTGLIVCGVLASRMFGSVMTEDVDPRDDASPRPSTSGAPWTARGFALRGHQRYEEGKFEQAIADFDEVIRRDGKDASALHLRGLAWLELEEYERAIADFDAVVRINPQYDAAYHNRAVAWYEKGECDKALVDYDTAIALDGKDPLYFVNRGKARKFVGDIERALADFDEAIRLSPRYDDAYSQRGSIWTDLGEFDKAIADYDSAIRLRPDKADYFTKRASVLKVKGEADRARADRQEAERLAGLEARD